LTNSSICGILIKDEETPIAACDWFVHRSR
jgi:hypothetical protein